MKKIVAEQKTRNGIGSLNEKPLHAALKEWYRRPSDQVEVPVNGYVIDILRGDELIEIQTGNFSAIRRKMGQLSRTYRVRLVYPIACEKWIIKLPVNEGEGPKKRKSPKKGTIFDLFGELIRMPEMMAHRNFVLEVVFTREEEIRRHDKKKAWRRKGWVIEERRLIEVVGKDTFFHSSDIAALLPKDLPADFTTADLARAIARPKRIAQQMAYCLKKMQQISEVGKKGRFILYRHEKK